MVVETRHDMQWPAGLYLSTSTHCSCSAVEEPPRGQVTDPYPEPFLSRASLLPLDLLIVLDLLWLIFLIVLYTSHHVSPTTARFAG